MEKFDKIYKNRDQCVFFLFLCLIMPTGQQFCVQVERMTCGQYKDKEETTSKKSSQDFSEPLRINFQKKTCSYVEICDQQLVNRQTEKQRQMQPFQCFRSPSLQPVIKERSNNVISSKTIQKMVNHPRSVIYLIIPTMQTKDYWCQFCII